MPYAAFIVALASAQKACVTLARGRHPRPNTPGEPKVKKEEGRGRRELRLDP